MKMFSNVNKDNHENVFKWGGAFVGTEKLKKIIKL